MEKQLNATFGRLLNSPNQAEKAQESKPKPELLVKLYGRGIRKTHTYEVYGKSGSIEFQLTDKIAFESDDAFWKYVNEHRAELEGKYRAFREEFSRSEKDWRSGNPIRDRVGPDYRQGKDATPEMFQETFGFRGVEFGNWVKQGKNGRERQWMLNNAYDSLMDLSKILDIPPKAVALDNELGLCFGSRGFGSASAHYEPSNRLINLTKTKGYSSLAHEWFHALDHYLMRTNYKEIQDPNTRYLSQQVDSDITFQLTDEAKKEISKRAEAVYRSAYWTPAHVQYKLKTIRKYLSKRLVRSRRH
ncbi:MAG: LPD5 domain-containing protein [Parasutterella excrementihominis]